MTQLRLTVQRASPIEPLPADTDFQRWAEAALADRRPAAELAIRIVDEAESAELNHRYRHKSSPTNVLSFPADLPAGITTDLLGDLVLCAPVVMREAAEQGKPATAHWAHLTVHGILHLLGYTHDTSPQAEAMEALETTILAGLGYPDPYSI